MGSFIIDKCSRNLNTDLLANIRDIRDELHGRKLWKLTGISGIPACLPYLIPHAIVKEASSTHGPIMWEIEWLDSTDETLDTIPATYAPLCMASNSALGIVSAVLLLCKGKGCTMNIQRVGKGTVTKIQIASGR